MRLKLLLLFLASSLIACSHFAAAARPLSLWSVQSDTAQVYLLGSIHVMRENMYPLAAPMTEAFEASDVAVFEVDMAESGGPGAMKLMQEMGRYPKGEDIYSGLDEETLALLEEYFAENQIDIRQFETVRPWMIAVNIGLVELGKMGFDASRGIDLHFQQKAKATGKPILALETFREQIELLSGDSPEVQELGLKLALLFKDEAPEFIDQLIAAWANGDADKMYEVSAADYERDPRLEAQFERLLDHRNERMATRILAFLEETDKTYFVVVGALHMGGEKGLLALLGKDYKVQQVHHSAQ